MLKGKLSYTVNGTVKSLDGRVGTLHIQLMDIWPDVLNGVRTPHKFQRKDRQVGGWVGGVKMENHATL